MRIGFVGTGSMENPIAANLINAGYQLGVHDIKKAATTNLLSLGAEYLASPSEIALKSNIVFLSLPSEVEVSQVCFGDNGLFSSINTDTFLIDLSTVSISLVPELEQAAAESGVRYLTSPVSEGVDNAKIGKLSIFVGGNPDDYSACLPIYSVIAKEAIYTGNHLTAISAKLLTNMLWYINAAAIGEALVIGSKSGIELKTLQKVILNSCGTSWVAEHDIPSIYAGNYDPSFTTKLCCKDLRLITELARNLEVPIELGATVEQIFRRTKNIYGGDSPELSLVKNLSEITQTNLHLDG